MFNVDFLGIEDLTDVVITNIDVFCPWVFDIVLDMIQGRFRVCVNDCRFIAREGKIRNKVADKDSFFGGFGEGNVFGFHC